MSAPASTSARTSAGVSRSGSRSVTTSAPPSTDAEGSKVRAVSRARPTSVVTRTSSRPVVRRRRSSAGRSSASNRPWSTATRSARRSASSRLCVETRMAQPAARRSSSSRRTPRVTSGSSPDVGSSSRRTAGSCMSARASATFCRIPFDSSAARVDARSGQLEEFQHAIDRAVGARDAVQPGIHPQVLANGQPVPESGRFGQESDAAAKSGAGCRRERDAADAHGSARRRDQPPSIRIVVVLPAPFGPRSATISERATSKLTFWTATREPKRRVRLTAEIKPVVLAIGQ